MASTLAAELGLVALELFVAHLTWLAVSVVGTEHAGVFGSAVAGEAVEISLTTLPDVLHTPLLPLVASAHATAFRRAETAARVEKGHAGRSVPPAVRVADALHAGVAVRMAYLIGGTTGRLTALGFVALTGALGRRHVEGPACIAALRAAAFSLAGRVAVAARRAHR